MIQFEVEVSASFIVSVDSGGVAAARRLARDHIANDWFLRVREGTAKDAGHYLIKGAVGLVGEARIFRANRSVTGDKIQEGEEIY